LRIGYQIQRLIANETEAGGSLIDILPGVVTFESKQAELERRCEDEERKRNDAERIPLFDRKRQDLGGIDPAEG
jgi:hypothetical protein